MNRAESLKFAILLLVFLVNFVVVDSITTITALGTYSCCYESNVIIRSLGLLGGVS